MHRETLNLSLPVEVVNRIKNTVYWSHGWTIGEFVTAACNKTLSAIEETRGGAFPDRNGLMRKGPQSYLPRTELLDLDEWLVAPEQRHEAAISILREAVSEVLKKTAHRSEWLDKEMKLLLGTKLMVDTGQATQVDNTNEETPSRRDPKEAENSQTAP